MRQDQAMRPEREGVRQAEPAGQLLRQCDGPGLVKGRICARHLRLTRGRLQATWQPSRLLRMGVRSLVVEIAVSGSAADAGSLAGGGLRSSGAGIEPANFVAGGFVEPHGIAQGELGVDGFYGLARPCRTLRHQRRQVFGGYRTVHQAHGTLADRFLDLDHCVSPVVGSPVQPMTREYVMLTHYARAFAVGVNPQVLEAD